jgi:mannose/cellobiose epimerase-like protein (N-acyl-D-glucosamine 2-epimerase family)
MLVAPSITKDQIRGWLFEAALPFWAANGTDLVNGGPVEQLSLQGHGSDAGFKRVRVFPRQIYVFSHAYELGWQPGLAMATAMFEAMVNHAWQGPDRGWAKLLNSDNSVLDPTMDLYDNAFALFGLGWYYRICPDERVLDYVLKTAEFIDTKLRHPKLGFWHQLPSTGPRLQNPHIHLLEACLVCFEATKAPIFERLAKEVIDLFNRHFFNSDRTTLCEYFDDELAPIPGSKGEIVEPGHQFEWAWILNEGRKLFGLDIRVQASGLVDFGETYGVHPVSSATFNVIDTAGQGVDTGSRTWPNTERIKAAVAMFELDGRDPRAVLEATLSLLFNKYLNSDVKGGWIDAFDGEGKAIAATMPTSTFYHVFLALAEVLRIWDNANDDMRHGAAV